MDTITSVAHLPKNAFNSFDDVPENQDRHFEKSHACSTDGLKNAISRLEKMVADYHHSHGDGAVCAAYIETDHGGLTLGYARYVAEYDFSDSAGLKNAMDRVTRILKEIDAEYQNA